MSAPAAYLAGDVWAEKNKQEAGYIPALCALLPPVGAILALIVLTQVSSEPNEGKDQ